MAGILDSIVNMLLGSRTQAQPTPTLPGLISGYGGGTFDMSGKPVTPVQSEEVPPQASAAAAPSATPTAGGTTAAPVGQPQGKRHGGLLGVLGSIFAPEAGSFMWGALNNPNGIYGARGAQTAYQQKQAADTLANQTAQAKLKQLLTKGEYQVVGNNVFHINPDGSTEMIGAPPQPSEQERLIERWKVTPPGPERDLIERAIRGYQYTAPVIAAQGQARTNTAVAGAAARGAEARKTKATPSASSGKSSGSAKLPTGFILNP